MLAAEAALVVSSAAFAAGSPGVPAAATVAASAVVIAASDAAFATWSPAAVAAGMPRQPGNAPINTFGLPGPGVSTGGAPDESPDR